ncbi:hypothetical protein [Streptomyces californicus]|uniref:hypothetical protein n=1 Tax=Streptomyces californicus TaxID=67351 RepID=UPI001E569B24|nr:hypothetical protein [Streptomyces californicus]MCC0579728.1 hypothetical protein [Streptomyces californicus]
MSKRERRPVPQGGQLSAGREVFDKAGLVLRRLKQGPTARPKTTSSHGESWGVTGA